MLAFEDWYSISVFPLALSLFATARCIFSYPEMSLSLRKEMQQRPKPTEEIKRSRNLCFYSIEVYKYLRFTENAKSLAVEEEKKKN